MPQPQLNIFKNVRSNLRGSKNDLFKMIQLNDYMIVFSMKIQQMTETEA